MESLDQKRIVIRAPGRINLLGEHLDYNHGIVLPAAINRYIEFEFEKSDAHFFRFEALDLNENWQFSLEDLKNINSQGWQSYVKGVILLMGLDSAFANDQLTTLKGLIVRFKSNIPIGAGLSSSAALCCGLAYGLNEWFGLGKSRMELALIAQQTEHQYAGVQCGLMDQVASLFGKENHLIAMDCLTNEITSFSLPLVGVQLFLIDSKVKHNLASSAYNQRRETLQKAWNRAKDLFPSLSSWRALDDKRAAQLMSALDLESQKRLQYVRQEIQGVEAIQALSVALNNKADFEMYQSLGSLLNQTHFGLRDLYEVSCEEIDHLQTALLKNPKVLGARMMGGGFGGCLLVLASKELQFSTLNTIFKTYEDLYHRKPTVEIVSLVEGVHRLV